MSPPDGVMELDNIDAAKQMVGQGLGVALLPRASVDAGTGRWPVAGAIDIEGERHRSADRSSRSGGATLGHRPGRWRRSSISSTRSGKSCPGPVGRRIPLAIPAELGLGTVRGCVTEDAGQAYRRINTRSLVLRGRPGIRSSTP